MARFYFHIKDKGNFIKDEEGLDLPSAEHARAHALQSARELWADAIRAGKNLDAAAFVISDEQGKHLTLVHVAEALPIQLRRLAGPWTSDAVP